MMEPGSCQPTLEALTHQIPPIATEFEDGSLPFCDSWKCSGPSRTGSCVLPVVSTLPARPCAAWGILWTA